MVCNTIKSNQLITGQIQGGDPTGTGRGGQSIWKKPFEDEFTQKLSHNARGILSMANSGKNTNGSQLCVVTLLLQSDICSFILYKPATHLDYKHTVFGRVVGGMETLKHMEAVMTDKDDRPTQQIRITATAVHVNPFEDADIYEDEEDIARKKEEAAKERKRQRSEIGQWYSNPGPALEAKRAATVGKYLPAADAQSTKQPDSTSTTSRPKSSLYGDFGDWV